MNLLQMIRDRRNREGIYSHPAYWDRKAAQSTGEATSMWPNNALNRHYHLEQTALLDTLLPAIDGWTVLDLGCGTGRISRHLAARGARVTGMDFSTQAVVIARSKSSGNNPRFVVGSMFELEGEALYDAICVTAAITVACQNAGHVREVGRRLFQVLRPQGRLVLLEPIHRGFLHRVLNMDASEFCAVLETTGFKDIQVRQMHFWPARLALAYVSWPTWITTPGYKLGQALMRCPGLRQLGDYKAISAIRPK
jgi:2-polyprenyl-3-methyl-5-hydroxy-6-metoxy-1,4-benzoquinol methylase